MFKKIMVLFLIIILLSGSTGCWDKIEPNQLAVITSIIYDIKDDGMYEVTMEFLSAQSVSAEGGSDGKANSISVGRGITVYDALQDAHTSLDKKMYSGSNIVRFVTVDMATQGLNDIIDFLLRDSLADERPYIIVIDVDNPMDIFKSQYGMSDMVGIMINSAEDTREGFSGRVVFPRTIDVIKDYYSEGRQPIASVLTLEPNETKNLEEEFSAEDPTQPYDMKFNFEGASVFKDLKLVGFIDGTQTRVYNLLDGEALNSYYTTEIEEGLITVKLKKSSVNKKVYYDKGKVNVVIKVTNMVSLIYNSSSYDPSRLDDVKIVEETLNQYAEEEIEDAISFVQSEYASDIFGFGQTLHAQNPKIWKEIKNEWDDVYFTSAILNIEVETTLFREGETREPLGRR